MNRIIQYTIYTKESILSNESRPAPMLDNYIVLYFTKGDNKRIDGASAIIKNVLYCWDLTKVRGVVKTQYSTIYREGLILLASA